MLPVNRNTVTPDGSGGVDVMAASSGTNAGIVVWNNNTSANTVTVVLTNLPFAGGAVQVYRIDSTHADFVTTGGSSENLAVNGTNSFTGKATTWTGSIPGQSLVYLEAISSSTSNPPPATAVFVKTDTVTEGNWKGVYGTDGFNVINDSNNYPAYADVLVSGTAFNWAAATTDMRALQVAANSTNRIAAAVYGSSLTVDCNLTDGKTHPVALYFLDWDSTARNETVQVTDATSDAVLDSETTGSFHNGDYLVWNVSGHVEFNISLNAGANAVLSGVFFGAPAAPPVLSVARGAVQLTINWTGSGTLAGATNVTGPWQPIASAVSGYQAPISGARMFFRVQ